MNIKTIFREYDIRGIYDEQVNQDLTKRIGYHFARIAKQKASNKKAYIVVSFDARLHSPQIADWLISGINATGAQVLVTGLVPTPVNYFTNFINFIVSGKKITPNASIMITGSHNPPQYNGFKITLGQKPFFGEEIYKLGETIKRCSHVIENNNASVFIDAQQKYVDYLVTEFKNKLQIEQKLANKKFVFDCGNGAAGEVLSKVLTKVGINNKILFAEPDGSFPNHHPDPSKADNLKEIKKELMKSKYILGFAYDGDADRLAVLSNKNNFKGDILAIFFAKFIKNPVVIGEVKCSQIMYDTINSFGKAIMYKTGHSNLKIKMKEENANLAAEVSGHLFFKDRYFGYDDAIYSTMRTLELVANGFDLDAEFSRLPQLFTTDEEEIDTTEEEKFEIMNRLLQKLNKIRYSEDVITEFPKILNIIAIDGLRINFEQGWALVRASNTTPKLITRFEANSKSLLQQYRNIVRDLVHKCCN